MYDAYARIFTRLGLDFRQYKQTPVLLVAFVSLSSMYWQIAAKTILRFQTPLTMAKRRAC
jgi:hypothetical protein